MIRLPGMLKVFTVLTVDFLSVYALFHDEAAAAAVVILIGLYVWLGGYFELFKEGAVRDDKLPSYERSRLENAKNQLVSDVRNTSSANISRLKVYLVPGDYSMQATAYSGRCVSVSRGTFDNTDPLTLNSVLAHEIAHALNFDPDFNRAVFATILIICLAISMVSFALTAVIFLFFCVCSFFRSWLGVMFFRGTTKTAGCIFQLIQKGVVVFFRGIISFWSRAAEFRADRYSAKLGYGIQLAHFLSYAAPETDRRLTFSEALYRTHPSTSKRIARLEKLITKETHLVKEERESY